MRLSSRALLAAVLVASALTLPGAGAEEVARVQASAFKYCAAVDPICNPGGSEYKLEVPVGTKVTWTYTDVVCDVVAPCPGHNVIFEGEPNEANKLQKGNLTAKPVLRERVFDTTGTFKYWCTPHKGQGMTGVVLVKA